MKKLLLAATICATLALSGCGDSEPKKVETPALTKAEFIKQADAICKATNDKMDQLGADINENTSMDEIQTFLEKKAIPEMTAMVAKIRDLEPPKADEKQVDTMLDAVEAEIAKVTKNPMALMGDGAFDAANKLAADYGLKTCSE
jgi:predicted Zn-dependent peptidase